MHGRSVQRTRLRTVNSVSRVSAAVSVQWDRVVLHRRLQEESADVMLMVS